MKMVSKINAITLFLALGLLVGCLDFSDQPEQKTESKAAPATSEKESKTSSIEDEKAPPDEGTDVAGICANKFYPIDTSSPRKYKVTGSSLNSYSLTQKKVGDDAFSETRTFSSDSNISSSWACTNEGLRNAEFNNHGTFSQANFKMETIESSGVTFPKEWELGKKWSSNYKVKATIKAGPVSGAGGGTVKINSEIVSMDEAVQVPGGSFQTAKVSSVLVLNITAQGRKMPARKINMTIWLSPEIGMVRQTVKGGSINEMAEYIGN